MWPVARVCRPSCGSDVGNCCRALCEHGVLKFRKRARHHCGVFAVWKKKGDQRLIIDARIPNTALDAPDPVALNIGRSCARVNVATNDPIFVSAVDIQVRPFKICSHLTPSKRGRMILLASSTRAMWTPGMSLCIPFLQCFLWVGIKLLNVCQWVHEHTAERVPGISAGGWASEDEISSLVGHFTFRA